MPTKSASLNIHEKLLKIADMAGVLRKNKKGYNYNYTTEDEIQAKITAGMQKYGVMLEPGIVPGTLNVQPITYQKYDKKVDKDITIHEFIVSCEVEYEWVNVDSPDQTIKKTWSYIGQMEDASQAFGAGATYGNRYYLLKALQLATIEDDPDNYRSKQKEAEQYEEKQADKEKKEQLKKVLAEIADTGSDLVAKGFPKEKLLELVGTYNDGNGNPNSIKDIEIANKVLEELKNAKIEKKKEEKETKKK